MSVITVSYTFHNSNCKLFFLIRIFYKIPIFLQPTFPAAQQISLPSSAVKMEIAKFPLKNKNDVVIQSALKMQLNVWIWNLGGATCPH